MSIADYSRQIYPHCPPTSTSVPGEDGNETAGCQPDQGGTTSGTKSPFRRGAPPYPSQFASHRYHGSTGDSTLCTSGTGEGILLLPLLPARAFGPADDQPVRGPVRCGCIHHRAGRPEAPGDHGSGTPPGPGIFPGRIRERGRGRPRDMMTRAPAQSGADVMKIKSRTPQKNSRTSTTQVK